MTVVWKDLPKYQRCAFVSGLALSSTILDPATARTERKGVLVRILALTKKHCNKVAGSDIVNQIAEFPATEGIVSQVRVNRSTSVRALCYLPTMSAAVQQDLPEYSSLAKRLRCVPIKIAHRTSPGRQIGSFAVSRVDSANKGDCAQI
ncbi:MAG TPA: hypothetical protein VG267_13885 [Terracidiphilus sp.]|nr:hypothetical protein [Terracidiphilus sp.]